MRQGDLKWTLGSYLPFRKLCSIFYCAVWELVVEIKNKVRTGRNIKTPIAKQHANQNLELDRN